MDHVVQVFDPVKIVNFEVGSVHQVYVTHIDNPNHFYIRPVEYDNRLPELETIYNHPKFVRTKDTFPLGSEVVYKSDSIGTLIRGHVRAVRPNLKYEIFALDYGFLENGVKLENMYIPYYPTNTPPLAVICSLAYCRPVSGTAWSQDSIDALRYFIPSDGAKIAILGISSDKLEVELIYNDEPEDMGILLIKTGHALFGMDQHGISRATVPLLPTKKNYTYKKCEIGDRFHVRLLHGKTLDLFYVAQINDYNTYTSKREQFNGFALHQKPVNPHEVKEGMPVAVKSTIDFKYERCIVTSVSDNKQTANVYYVDCGGTTTVSIATMREISKDMYFVNYTTSIYCVITEEQKTFRLQKSLLHTYLMPGQEFIITILGVGDSYKKPFVVKVAKL